MTPPLSGPDAAILELLEAGRSFDDVCEVGRYRKAWRPSAVHRVVSQWLPERRPKRLKAALPRGRPPVPGERRGPAARDINHGTESGYVTERKRGVPYCEDCREAHNDAQRARRKRTA